MRPENPKGDRIRVQHMLDAAKEALLFVEGRSREDLQNDRKLVLSLIKDLEILGEAASKVTDDFRRQHRQIPWEIIVKTRHRLIHGYFDIDLDVVWETVTGELPKILTSLQKIIEEDRNLTAAT